MAWADTKTELYLCALDQPDNLTTILPMVTHHQFFFKKNNACMRQNHKHTVYEKYRHINLEYQL